MKKIVFFDIDGTLLDSDKQLPKSTKHALEQLKDNGVFVAIATGRAPFMFDRLRKELDIDSFVSFNGQYVVFENEVIFKNGLPSAELEKLVTYSSERGHSLVFLDEKEMKSSELDNRLIEESIGSLKFPYPEKDIEFYKNKEIYQALVFSEEKEDAAYERDFPNFRFIRWHQFSTDVLPAGGSKAEGIKLMISRLGIEMKNVYAFGDGLNDKEMLQSVGTGIAMGNALDEVKLAADVTTTSVNNNGIWDGLKKVGLI
ncbi:Cof-type HAD-IIB family hydrolase [Bacillus sp. DTU_2020_1000418_1_SI_GHA_SEK_038]|uniref:Cof-type HAD-IIB family hydrolase n=1 Tax=Bacillus sp. DTU_2020_1000418_1_SI_GHA_SEK_038 TaxID=3077585 RepID=UPI0028E9D2EC|nr:Cof-type HAD-IIB family hydrolase [Bacillus sp. DTU_2020_1000418_1_SI_GHA_SEK_038]WNS77006.1 Cof-type HAD-IIB family hydrolase [Bacillus sp. DTU_2020_1000418_1_SI_GHA_SEK_038]